MYFIFAWLIHICGGGCTKRPYDNGDGKTDNCVICGKKVT